jgi:hypothetical protein
MDVSISLLSKQEIKELYSDGRAISPMLEKIIPKIFNLTRADGNGYDYLIEDTDKRVELKMITKNGTKTSPSCMQGKSRKYDLEKHKDTIKSNYAYLFIDITQFPKIRIYIIKSCDDLIFKEKAYSTSIKLLNSLCKKYVKFNQRIIIY